MATYCCAAVIGDVLCGLFQIHYLSVEHHGIGVVNLPSKPKLCIQAPMAFHFLPSPSYRPCINLPFPFSTLWRYILLPSQHSNLFSNTPEMAEKTIILTLAHFLLPGIRSNLFSAELAVGSGVSSCPPFSLPRTTCIKNYCKRPPTYNVFAKILRKQTAAVSVNILSHKSARYYWRL